MYRSPLCPLRHGGVVTVSRPEGVTGTLWDMPRFLRWLFWAVLAALTPFYGAFMALPHGSPPSAVLVRGELLILNAALLSTALGEVVGGIRVPSWLRTAIGGVLGILLLLTIITFALSIQRLENSSINRLTDTGVTRLSIIYAVCTLLACGYVMLKPSTTD